MRYLVFGLTCLLLAGCQEFSAPDYSNKNLETSKEVEVFKDSIKTDQGTEIISGVVMDVADGNQFRIKVTEDVLLNGVRLHEGELLVVRMLLSQAPERIDSLPFGEESYAFVYDLLMGQPVSLEFEPGNLQDSLGRYVAYTYLEDYRVQDLLIENGFAKLDELNTSSAHLEDLQKLEEIARTNTEGIWSIPDYASEGGFNAFINDSSNFTKVQLDALESELSANGTKLKDSVYKMINK